MMSDPRIEYLQELLHCLVQQYERDIEVLETMMHELDLWHSQLSKTGEEMGYEWTSDYAAFIESVQKSCEMTCSMAVNAEDRTKELVRQVYEIFKRPL